MLFLILLTLLLLMFWSIAVVYYMSPAQVLYKLLSIFPSSNFWVYFNFYTRQKWILYNYLFWKRNSVLKLEVDKCRWNNFPSSTNSLISTEMRSSLVLMFYRLEKTSNRGFWRYHSYSQIDISYYSIQHCHWKIVFGFKKTELIIISTKKLKYIQTIVRQK